MQRVDRGRTGGGQGKGENGDGEEKEIRRERRGFGVLGLVKRQKEWKRSRLGLL